MDFKGQWRGIEYISSIINTEYGDNREEDRVFEQEINCYTLSRGKVCAIENLYEYWTKFAELSLEDFKNMQVIIFEGEKFDKQRANGEDLVICTKTIKKIDAYDFIKTLESAKVRLESFESGWDDEDQITKEEYNSIVEGLI